MKKQLIVTALFAMLVAGLGSETRADDRQRLDAAISTLNSSEAKHGVDSVVSARIATETGVSIETLRMERVDSGLGFGDLYIAHELATRLGKTFAGVVVEFKAGKGFGQIATEGNVNWGALAKSAHLVEAKVASDWRKLERRGFREQLTLEKKVDALNAAAKHEDDVSLARIASAMGMSVETLRSEKTASRLSYGELYIATRLAKASGRVLSVMTMELRTGKNWGELATESNLKLGELSSGLAKLTAEIKRGHARTPALPTATDT